MLMKPHKVFQHSWKIANSTVKRTYASTREDKYEGVQTLRYPHT